MFQEVTIQGFFNVVWVDTRLIFPPNYTDSYITVGGNFVNKVWRPDIYFYGGRDYKKFGLLKETSFFWLYNNSKVFYSTEIIIKLACNMKFMYYPLDTQVCPIILESCKFIYS